MEELIVSFVIYPGVLTVCAYVSEFYGMRSINVSKFSWIIDDVVRGNLSWFCVGGTLGNLVFALSLMFLNLYFKQQIYIQLVYTI